MQGGDLVLILIGVNVVSTASTVVRYCPRCSMIKNIYIYIFPEIEMGVYNIMVLAEQK